MVKNVFIVEFIGLPGVGKSTISHRVAAFLSQRGISVNEPSNIELFKYGKYKRIIRKGIFIAREVIFHPKGVWLSAKIIISTKQRFIKDLIKVFLNWVYVSSMRKSCSEVYGVHLFDQGIFQALWSIGFGAMAVDFLNLAKILFNSLEVPHVVVVLNASQDTIKKRLTKRTICHSRLEKWYLDDGQIIIKASALLNNIKKAIDSLSIQNENISIIVIDNDRDDYIERRALEITNFLEKIVIDR